MSWASPARRPGGRSRGRRCQAPAGQPRPSDLLERDFTAAAPARRWVADITYVDTASGFVYTAFVTDLFSRRIVGWQVADTLRAELALDALEMAIWSSGDKIGDQLIHHSDRGVQYTSIRYAERLGDIGAVRSVGSKGDSYDNAAAESVNSLYKKELIDRDGPWNGVRDVTFATMEWVAWYNSERLHSACGYIPPKEFEENYYDQQDYSGSIIVFGKQGPPNFPGRSTSPLRSCEQASTTDARIRATFVP